jgi:hypothetical protein
VPLHQRLFVFVLEDLGGVSQSDLFGIAACRRLGLTHRGFFDTDLSFGQIIHRRGSYEP